MRRTLRVAFIISFFLIVPSRCVAKGATTKIVIEGADLANPIEITDRKGPCKFQCLGGSEHFPNGPHFQRAKLHHRLASRCGHTTTASTSEVSSLVLLRRNQPTTHLRRLLRSPSRFRARLCVPTWQIRRMVETQCAFNSPRSRRKLVSRMGDLGAPGKPAYQEGFALDLGTQLVATPRRDIHSSQSFSTTL